MDDEVPIVGIGAPHTLSERDHHDRLDSFRSVSRAARIALRTPKAQPKQPFGFRRTNG